MQAEAYYIIFSFFSALMAGLTALLALSREARAGRRSLVFCLLASGWWAFFEGLIFLGGGLETNVLLTRIQYFGIVAAPPLIFYYIIDYLGYLKVRRRRTALILAVVPALTLVLVFTNDAHHLMWREMRLVEMGGVAGLEVVHGPFFWAYTIYNYLLLATGGVLVLRAFLRTHAIFRWQFAVILLALLLPVAGNALYLFDIITEKPFDFTPISFSAATLVIAAGFFYFKLQDLLPIAKERIFTSIPDGIMVLDDRDRIIYANRALALPLGNPGRYYGKPAATLYPTFPRLDRVLGAGSGEAGITVSDAPGEKEFDVRISELHDRRGKFMGRLLLFRDITERMRLESELRRIATTDELTGLLNRREFLERAGREFLRSLRYDDPISVLLFDVDRFKDINDGFGHAAGDEALRRLARAGEECVRATDIFGRLGGDEFAVLLLETGIADAVGLAERLRSTLSDIVVNTDRRAVRFTVSIGVASRDGETTLDELMSRADRSLYRAKRAGRNRVDAT
ncbi:MAG: histidine kinase N-terminal 7TM domain-containing protein [Spirochaetaceae bacterium]